MMTSDIGNYAQHARYWDWGGHDRSGEYAYWFNYAAKYGKNILIPMCAWGETGAYMAERGMNVTAFDITPEMIAEGRKRFGGVSNLRLFDGDVRDFRFDIQPADFCFSMDFGHILTIEDVKRALVCINNHLRDGGCLVIETGLRVPGEKSEYHPSETFYPLTQVYPDIKVWKTGDTRIDAETGRCYISQTFYAEDTNGNVESFDHAFYLQGYYREEWLAAFKECGFDIAGEYNGREAESRPGSVSVSGSDYGCGNSRVSGSGGSSYSDGSGSGGCNDGDSGGRGGCNDGECGGGYRIFEVIKSSAAKKRYSPQVSFDYLQTPIYRYENVALYNDKINLEQPNSGFGPYYQFVINADGKWVGGIFVRIGYSIRIHYSAQIGYWIDDESNRNRGYMTKALLALKPFLKKCGFKHVLISNDENNAASRRVCEKIGATLIDVVDTPVWSGLYQKEGQRRTSRYEWAIEDTEKQYYPGKYFRHIKIDLDADRDYIFERHCRINYECDTPWARKLPYEQYRADWFANAGQQEGFMFSLRESMEDPRTIAEIIKTESNETAGYLWVPFHAGTESFMCWADVQDIYIEEAYRKTGVASYLMDYAEKEAKRNGARVIRSGTGCENAKSQGLHQKLGYYQYRMEYENVLREK
jgi:RimJ/RimL family protein N-acetyltransferase/SAM-dependent methyltransferase